VLPPARITTVTQAGLESQKRTAPTGAVASLNAGGCRRYVANRAAASAKRGSADDSFRRSRSTYLW
jgi:hypothetical protein